MRSKLFPVTACATLSMLSFAAHADLYSNPFDPNGNGACEFNTTCAAGTGSGNDYAAQQFTIGLVEVVGGSFTIGLGDNGFGNNGALATSVNWALLSAVGALPGSVIASGMSSISQSVLVGHSVVHQVGGTPYAIYQEDFNISSVPLAAGTYFLAIQAVTSNFGNFLWQGTSNLGAAETHNGLNGPWTTSYGGGLIGGVAVSLDAVAVPGPVAGAGLPGLILVGSGLLGWWRRRRPVGPHPAS
jgi:hypothetical protein